MKPTAGAPPRVVHITTVPLSLRFLRGQARFLQRRGFDVVAVSSAGEELEAFAAEEGVAVHAVEMRRRITPLRDLIALWRLVRLLRRLRPAVVHSHTPKAGLLGMLAATLARVPARVYHMRGLPMATAKGLQHVILRACERLSCRLSHHVLCNSASLRDLALSHRLCAPRKLEVLGAGSGNGVDARGRFDPAQVSAREREELRQELKLPSGALVLGFVGRLVRDKGIVELADAWQELKHAFPSLVLVLTGPLESRDAVPDATRSVLEVDPRVRFAGFRKDMPRLYSVLDVVALPSHREGFPNVPLEAAAMGIPVVATRVPGCVDAVKDGETGLLVPAGDARALAAAIGSYLEDPALRREHGRSGREWVLREFEPERIWEGILRVYERLGARGAM